MLFANSNLLKYYEANPDAICMNVDITSGKKSDSEVYCLNVVPDLVASTAVSIDLYTLLHYGSVYPIFSRKLTQEFCHGVVGSVEKFLTTFTKEYLQSGEYSFEDLFNLNCKFHDLYKRRAKEKKAFQIPSFMSLIFAYRKMLILNADIHSVIGNQVELRKQMLNLIYRMHNMHPNLNEIVMPDVDIAKDLVSYLSYMSEIRNSVMHLDDVPDSFLTVNVTGFYASLAAENLCLLHIFVEDLWYIANMGMLK